MTPLIFKLEVQSIRNVEFVKNNISAQTFYEINHDLFFYLLYGVSVPRPHMATT